MKSRNRVFNCHNCKEIKYLTRLRLCLSHLCQHKFKHNFQDTLNEFYSCRLNVDANTHFFPYCPLLTNQRRTLLSKLMNDIDSSNDKYTNDSNDKYSNVKYTNKSILTLFFFLVKFLQILSGNTLILTATMKHISTNRFQKSIFLVFCNFLLYFHLFNFFPYPYVFFFETIHSYSFSSWVCFYLFINIIFFTFSFWLYPDDSRIFKAPNNFLI